MLQVSYASCSKCDLRLIQQPGKETTIFKNKSLQFSHNKYFLQAHFFIENNPNFLLLSKQEPSVKKQKSTSVFNSILFALNTLILNSERLALPKMFCFNLWFFKRYLYNSNLANTIANQLWRFEYTFSCLKCFFYNFCKGCNQHFVSNNFDLYHLASLSLIATIPLVTIQLIAYQQLHDKGPCFSLFYIYKHHRHIKPGVAMNLQMNRDY